ncbi:hypothetical protein CTKA_00227 [Chthonomonas calidirosea]|uniref:Uncharacterized protein n=1 Tax=Chthonomonas calidirosea (strain DSM 23976 / ICMP 18418 / T49) TaxID=1303518 RepID=S0EWN0_CHTCT|nr:hypothetical protein [Chthonomonas calidirosea]CCW34754.1 hypothetical protein CCALI_00932 [Chthonomonas calidirosea T49]CEK13887.1 hypothetical protein CTKA_00227 [Chthonomonas calidirosea]
MQKEIHPGIVAAIVIVLVVIIGLLALRMFHSPAAGRPLTPQQAGLGKPVLPSIPPQPARTGQP